jgi:hypothetical protein
MTSTEISPDPGPQPTPVRASHTGVAWAIDHPRGRLLGDDMEDTNEDIDRILAEHLTQ